MRNFSKQFNNQRAIDNALKASKADIEYREACRAFDRDDFQSTLDHFFIAIHQRYDIEKPVPRRFLRKKLSVISLLREQIEEAKHEREKEVEALRKELSRLKRAAKKQSSLLAELATEYVIMGKECENEDMPEAAISNYQKALRLCPDHPIAKQRIKKLKR